MAGYVEPLVATHIYHYSSQRFLTIDQVLLNYVGAQTHLADVPQLITTHIWNQGGAETINTEQFNVTAYGVPTTAIGVIVQVRVILGTITGAAENEFYMHAQCDSTYDNNRGINRKVNAGYRQNPNPSSPVGTGTGDGGRYSHGFLGVNNASSMLITCQTKGSPLASPASAASARALYYLVGWVSP